MDDPSTVTVSPGHASAALPQLPPGTVVAVRYELRRLLGRGGSAYVYAAFDRDLRQDVAIKILRADRTTDQSLRRFRREVVCAREATNDHLLRLFDIGEAGGLVYLTMDLIEGGTVADLLDEGPLPIDRAVDIAAQALEALEALHRAGVVHRDVKPSNLLLTREGTVKLGDFGLVRRQNVEESVPTTDDVLVGTWSYLSPEQAMGREVTPQSDLYSFGAVLYEMLTGARLFAAELSIATVVARVYEKAPDVRRSRPDAPRWLARMVARLLAKAPRDRYGSAAEALRDLRRKRVRARLRWVPAAGAALAIASVVAVFLFWSARQAGRFDHLADFGDSSVRAYAHDGRVLWSRRQLRQRFTAMARMPGGRRLIASVPVPATGGDLDLQFFDPQTGAIVKHARLPNAAIMFPQFSAEFVPMVVATDDIDGSGVDKVFVTFTHIRYWPSFTDEFDPQVDRGWILFVGSGHHRIGGFVDVDGDGRKEVILFGPNNRMGWFNGVAAVPVLPENGRLNSDLAQMASYSPDEDRLEGPNGILWYTLVRRGFSSFNVQNDQVHKLLSIPLTGGPPVRITYDGFVAGSGSKPAPMRQAARGRAYAAIREAQRLSDERQFAESLRFAGQAVTEAAAAEDALLREWSERVLGKTLIDLGRLDEAEAIFQRLLTSSAASDSCYDAAHEFHRRRELARAIRWYRAGLGPGSALAAGRLKYEFLEGEVLALGELGRWREAEEAIQTFRRGYPGGINPDAEIEAFVTWRLNGSLPAQRFVNPGHTDMQRYWMLELSCAAGDDPAALLKITDAEPQRISGSDVLVRSIRAGLLERLSRREEALRLARAAWQEARLMTDDIEVRASLDLVERRYREIQRAAH